MTQPALDTSAHQHGLPDAPLPGHQPNRGPLVAVVVSLIVVAGVIGGWLLTRNAQPDARELESKAQAWRTPMSSVLTSIHAQCQTSCKNAGPYFHPQVHAKLMAEVEQHLDAAALKALTDPTNSQAALLHMASTEADEALTSDLKLKLNQCVRLQSGRAKAIGCSVQNPGETRGSLRIVHLENLSEI